MKNFILIAALTLTAVSAQADCISDFKDATAERINRNDMLRIGVLTASAASVFATGGASMPVFGAAFIANWAYGNQTSTEFSKIEGAIVASATSNMESKPLNNLLKDLNKSRVKQGENLVSLDDLSHLLNEANSSEALCPKVMDDNGHERSTVMGRKALIVYLNSELRK